MSNTSYISILNAAPLPQIVIDGQERIVAANTGAQRLFGDAIVARHYITALRQPNLLDAIEQVQSGRVSGVEATYLTSEAQRETSYRAVVGRITLDGDEPALLVSFVDTTDLQEAGQMRRDFVANVSHELRTPLTALLGFIETLRGAARDDAEARGRFLEIMEREAGRMNRLVGDLLSLSRVEADERVRPQEAVDIAALARTAVATLRPVAAEIGADVHLIGAEGAALVRGDPDQLEQVLSNLVENAVKYGGGEVRLTVRPDPEDTTLRGPAVVVTVEDNGDGIDPIHIPRLTERFYRVDTHRSREMGGTGLGLAIVKHIVNRHRGRLAIESEPGTGSRFTVSLPAA